MSTSTSDVIVIGSGVIGTSVAFELARDGWAVTVVDRASGPGHGSTGASSAVVRFNYSTWAGVISAWESKHMWADWANHLEASEQESVCRYYKTGGLVLDSPNQDAKKVLTLFDRARIPYDIWDAEAIRRNLPHVDPGRHYPPKRVTEESFWQPPHGELGGYWTPDAGFVDDPALAAHNLMNAARRRSAMFRFGAEVIGIRQHGSQVRGVDLLGGEHLAAPVVVNASGPHSGRVNAMAGVGGDFTIHTAPLRQEVHEVPAPKGTRTPAPMLADLDLGTYSRGTPSGQVIVGGTEPECDDLQWLTDPDDAQSSVSRATYEAQTYRLARRMPELHVPNTPRGVVGIYDVSDDWVPIYDKTDLGGFYVAIGTSGNQFKNAPLVGQYMAQIIRACERGADHDAQPVQAVLKHTGHTVDLSAYSRRREITKSSSFSVMG